MSTSNWIYFWSLLIVFVLLTGFSNMRSNHRKINTIAIKFTPSEERFLSPEIVNKMLIQRKDSAFFHQKDILALNKVEKRIIDPIGHKERSTLHCSTREIVY